MSPVPSGTLSCTQRLQQQTHHHAARARISRLLSLCASGLEIATILYPQWFLVMGSCANMIKGLSWMAGGSTRSVFNLSFVRDNNIAGVGLTPVRSC